VEISFKVHPNSLKVQSEDWNYSVGSLKSAGLLQAEQKDQTLLETIFLKQKII
jgi:hypothetical protein